MPNAVPYSPTRTTRMVSNTTIITNTDIVRHALNISRPQHQQRILARHQLPPTKPLDKLLSHTARIVRTTVPTITHVRTTKRSIIPTTTPHLMLLRTPRIKRTVTISILVLQSREVSPLQVSSKHLCGLEVALVVVNEDAMPSPCPLMRNCQGNLLTRCAPNYTHVVKSVS